MTQPRAHRPAHSPVEAASALRADLRLDAEAVEAVLGVAGHRVHRHKPMELTEREGEVLPHVARGETSKQIAGALGVSRRTVDHHVADSYDKAGVTTRGAAVLWAIEPGIAEL